MTLTTAEELEYLPGLEAEATERERENGRWRPRPYQQPLWSFLDAGGLRADVAAHRRWGKDDVALNWAREAMSRRVGVYWHMLPEAAQAKKAIWNAINPHTGKKRIDEAFPVDDRRRTNNTEMLIEMDNGAIWQVVGSDNYNSLVGAPPIGVVFSEWSLARPEAWQYMRPILAENGGWAIFIWTPRGRNHATTAFEVRAKDPTWLTLKSSALDTGVFTDAQLDREKAELIAESGSKEEGEARFASEYLVSFDAAVPGSYYGSLISDAETQKRITRVPHDPGLQVFTAWDLGIDDYTAIWFFQNAGREVRVIGYYETGGQGLPAIVGEAVAGKPYLWGGHHLPHDVTVRELSTGKSRYDTLRGLGLNNIIVGTAIDPEERINASRQMLPMCVFDEEACALGLNRLRGYRKRWNRATSTFTGPLHDENSHGADAFGEFALNRRGAQVTAPKPKPRVHAGAGGWMSA